MLLSCAVDALEVAFTMVDMSAADQPMVWLPLTLTRDPNLDPNPNPNPNPTPPLTLTKVWLSRGFERITGYSRAGAAGRNCRFLQARVRV